MYVKKFESETLDDALKQVKRELGPDAIILKTVTNKGLKGAFKKSRIELTAAISEDNLSKKMQVDKVLTPENTEKFYDAPASSVNQMINDYTQKNSKVAKTTSDAVNYLGLGLNKSVVTKNTKSPTSQAKSGLDDFLSGGFSDPAPKPREELTAVERELRRPQRNTSEEDHSYIDDDDIIAGRDQSLDLEMKHQFKNYSNRIEILEQRIRELTHEVHETSQVTHASNEDNALRILTESFKSLDISQEIILEINRRAVFELTEQDLHDEDLLFDFALRYLSDHINTAMPMFSDVNESDENGLTVMINSHSGEMHRMALKVAALIKDADLIISTTAPLMMDVEMVKKIYGINVKHVSDQKEIIYEIKESYKQGKDVLLSIDFERRDDEVKSLLSALKRSFDRSEFLLNISAVSQEVFNRKNISKYREWLGGIIIDDVEKCLSLASILNVHWKYLDLPMKLYGTGPIVPDDIETATSERLLSSVFKL